LIIQKKKKGQNSKTKEGLANLALSADKLKGLAIDKQTRQILSKQRLSKSPHHGLQEILPLLNFNKMEAKEKKKKRKREKCWGSYIQVKFVLYYLAI